MSSRIIYSLILFFLILAGFLARTYDIRRSEFWLDELATIQYTNHEVSMTLARSHSFDPKFHFPTTVAGYFWRSAHFDYQPPLYYLMIYGFSSIFPDEMALRYLSTFWGILSLWILYRVTRYFLEKPESLMAVAIMTGSSFHIWYAQEARGYTIFCFLFLLAVYCFLRMKKHSSRLWWFAFLVTAATAVMFTYYAIFIFGLLLTRKKTLKQNSYFSFSWLIGLVLTGAAILLGPIISQQIGCLSHGRFWLPPPSTGDLIFFPVICVGGYLSERWQLLAGIVIFWLLLWRGLCFLHKNTDKNKFITLCLLTIFPVLLIFLSSRTFNPIFIARHLIIFSPFFYIIFVYGILSFPMKWPRILVTFILFILLFFGWINFRQGSVFYKEGSGEFYPGIHERKQYVALIKHIKDNLQPDEKIVATDMQATIFLRRVLPSAILDAGQRIVMLYPGLLEPFELESFRGWSMSTKLDNMTALYGLLRFDQHIMIDKRTWHPASFWLIGSSWDKDLTLGKNFLAVRDFITKDYVATEFLSRDGVLIWHYKRKILPD